MPEITLLGYECTRCGHRWRPRLEARPLICPRCKSAYWDRPRRAPAVARTSSRALSPAPQEAADRVKGTLIDRDHRQIAYELIARPIAEIEAFIAGVVDLASVDALADAERAHRRRKTLLAKIAARRQELAEAVAA